MKTIKLLGFAVAVVVGICSVTMTTGCIELENLLNNTNNKGGTSSNGAGNGG